MRFAFLTWNGGAGASLKILTASLCSAWPTHRSRSFGVLWSQVERRGWQEPREASNCTCAEVSWVMAQKTCAACDCKLDETSIKVRIGGKTVEVCCEECAQKLKEAHASTGTPGKG
jgi:hypothetical protein